MSKPFWILAAIAGGALAYSLLKTVKAGLSLDYKLRKFQLYQFVNGNNMIFRLTLRIVNLSDTPIHVNMIDIDAYLDPTYTEENGKLIVSKSGSQLGSVVDAEGFEIPANAYIDKEIFIECRWINLLAILTSTVLDIINNEESAIQYFLNKKILISGIVKAEGYQIPVQNIIAVTN